VGRKKGYEPTEKQLEALRRGREKAGKKQQENQEENLECDCLDGPRWRLLTDAEIASLEARGYQGYTRVCKGCDELA
jgi:DNA-binding PadR family transcriptional regulator